MKCCEIKLGDLNTPIKIQKQTRQSVRPGETDLNHDIETVYAPLAKVKTLASQSLRAAQQGTYGDVTVGQGFTTHRFTVRWVNKFFDASMWVENRHGKRFDIKMVENIDEQDQFIVFHCSEAGDASNSAVR